MNDAYHRIQAYHNKFDPARIEAILTARRASMETKLTTVFINQESVEALVRATLAGITGSGAPTSIQSPFYQAASKQMMKCVDHWAGGGITDQEMGIIIATWTARGLKETTLEQLAYEVFHWTPPGPV